MTALPMIHDATAICSLECGAKCCRAEKGIIVRTDEMRRLKALAADRDLKIAFRHLQTVNLAGQSRWQLQQHDHRCPFLSPTLNLCSIYQDRPAVCAAFPTRPHQGCLLMPGGPADPSVEA